MATSTTRQGGTWDSIAHNVFGDEGYMQPMIRLNPEHVDTLVFGGGVSLELPDRQAYTPPGLPPWKEA